MGEVFRASDTRLKRDVAIKVLPEALSQDPDRVARFQREAELLASLNHPNIAQIYGLERQEGQEGASFIVMELVDCSGRRGKGHARVSPNGGTPELLAAVGADQMASGPQMLPGGKALLFSLKKTADTWDKGQIVAQSLATGERKVLVNGGADGRYLPTGHVVYALSGVLLAVRFDPTSLTRGGAVPVVQGIQRSGLNPGGLGLAQFSYSSNGVLLYLPGPVNVTVAGGDRDLAVFDLTGGIRPLKLPPGTYRSPRASPDGKVVAFDGADEGGEEVVWVYEIAGGSAMRRLTFRGKNRAPVWSPDGQWIAFQSNQEGDVAVFRQRADGTGNPERLTKPDPQAVHTPQSWSPDGAYPLVTVEKNRQFTLSTLSMKDRQLTPFGDVQSIEPTEASFSPDGRWVVYQTRGTSGPRRIFVQAFPSGAKYLVPNGPSRDAVLDAQGRGNRRQRRTGAELRDQLQGNAAGPVGRPVEFPRAGCTELNPALNRRFTDAMPDGEHLIGVTTAGAAAAAGAAPAQQITVVLNSFDDVRQKVPAK